MTIKRTLLSTAVVLGGSAIIATGAAQAATPAAAQASTPATITEAGSTLVYPLVSEWSTNFGIDTGDTVNSQSVGSGAGIADVCGGLVQIGASDAPLGYPGVKVCQPTGGTAVTQSKSYAAKYVEVPWALSATGIIYRIPKGGGKYITNGLHLTANQIVEIYTGKVKNWDQLKTNMKLPNVKITPVYREDGSGDSYAITNFMSKANSSWRSKYGPTTSFPTTASSSGIGETGNSGVAGEVEAVSGSIGYVSNFYSIEVLNSGHHVGIAAVGNAAGKYEFPNVANMDAAANSISKPPAQNTTSGKFFGMAIQYPSKKYSAAYPISTYTYAIVPKAVSGGGSVRAFLNYAVSKSYDGQPGGLEIGTSIGFAPITSTVQSYDKKVIATIK